MVTAAFALGLMDMRDPVDVEIFADEIDAKVAARIFNWAYLSGARSAVVERPARVGCQGLSICARGLPGPENRGRRMSGNTNMRPAGYRSKFGTTAKTAWEYWNIYCFAIAIGFHSLAKDALDAHFRVIEQELEGW